MTPLIAQLAIAQSQPTLVTAGYNQPGVTAVAPGQVITLTLAGFPTVLQPGIAERATQTPLPTSLAGFSAAIAQQPGSGPEPLPIFSVEQDNVCSGAGFSSAACALTSLTVQIPFDLIVDYGRESPVSHITTVTVTGPAGASNAFPVLLYPANIHVLTTCDSSDPNRTAALFPSACQSIVTHADGTFVSASAPARPGEALVLYAFGLGPTSPAAVAGLPGPAPAAIATGTFQILFAVRGAGAVPAEETPYLAPNPWFVGLTPGEIGLYQVNFTLPPSVAPSVGCDVSPDNANVSIFLLTDLAPSIGSAQVCVTTG